LKVTRRQTLARIISMHQICVSLQNLPLEFVLWFFGLPAASILIILITLVKRKHNKKSRGP